jgi:N-acetylglucosaminyl-diphospho-decaprenol L-rhamnosyltransferase
VTQAAAQPILSVCVVSWNTRDLLADCLSSLEADPEYGGWEVVVVDNASADGSATMVASRFPRVRLIRNPSNLGFAGANNLAMAQARGRYLALLNPDTRVRIGALGGLVRHMEREPTIGAVGPRLEDPDGTLQLSCGRVPSLGTEIVGKLLLHKVFPFFKLGRWNHAEDRDVGWVTGACLMARREAVAAVGPLDAGIFMFYEDLEWCLRLRRCGWRIVYVPGSRVVHLGGQSVRQDFRHMLVISQRSLYYLFSKHYSLGALHALRVLTVVEMLLRSLLWLPLRYFSSTRSAEARERLQAYREILGKTFTDRAYWSPFAAEPPPDPS